MSPHESVSARFAFFRLSCFRRFCSFFARFFALAFAFFFLSLSHCFTFLASSFSRRLQSLSNSMITSRSPVQSHPLAPLPRCSSPWSQPFLTVCAPTSGLLFASGPGAGYPCSVPKAPLAGKATPYRLSFHPPASVLPYRPPVLRRGRPGSFISACSDDLLLRRHATGVHDLGGPCVSACVAPWAPGLPPPACGFSTFRCLPDSSFM